MATKTPVKATKAQLLQLNKNLLRQNTTLLSRAALASRLGQSFGGERDYYEILGYKLDPTWEDFLNVYERGIGKRVSDVIAEETWRLHPVLTEDKNQAPDEDNPSQLQVDFTDLVNKYDLWAKFLEADKSLGYSRYSLLYMGLSGNPEEPVKAGSSNQLMYVQVQDESNSDVNELQIDQNPQSERFGLPVFYNIVIDDSKNMTIPVHYTRVIHIKEGTEKRGRGRIYGVPRLKDVLNYLDDLQKVLGGGSEAFWKLVYQGVVLSAKEGYTMPASDTAEYEAMQEEWDEWEHGLRRVVRAQGLDTQFLGGQVVDSREQFDVNIAAIAGTKGYPQRKLIGSAQGQAASAHEDEKDWNDNVDGRRKNFAESYILREFLDYGAKVGFITLPDSYYVYWPPLAEPTVDEEAGTAVKIAQAANQISGGAPETVMPPDEFASRLPGKWKFTWTPKMLADQDEKNTPPPPSESTPQPNLDNLTNPDEQKQPSFSQNVLSTVRSWFGRNGGNGKIDTNRIRKALMSNSGYRLETPDGPVLIHNVDGYSAMVAFLIPDNLRTDLQIQYPFMSDEVRDNLHITLAFLGDVRTLDMKKVAWAVADFVEIQRPIKTKLQGIARFVSGGEQDAIVATIDSPDFPALRSLLTEMLDRHGIPYHKEHGFIPHMTLAYIDKDDPMPIDTVEPLEMNFDTVYIQVGNEKIGFALSTDRKDTALLQNVETNKIKMALMGGEGSGNFDHAGRPGKVGGSQGEGEIKKSPFASGPQFSSNPVLKSLEEKIRNQGLSRDERKQAAQDRSTVQAALTTKYKDGSTIAETIDKLIASGHNQIKSKGPRKYLAGDDGQEWTLNTKVERDYAEFVLKRK